MVQGGKICVFFYLQENKKIIWVKNKRKTSNDFNMKNQKGIGIKVQRTKDYVVKEA